MGVAFSLLQGHNESWDREEGKGRTAAMSPTTTAIPNEGEICSTNCRLATALRWTIW